MRNSIFNTSILALAIALTAAPALANETASTEVEAQDPTTTQVLTSALSGMVASAASGVTPAVTAQCSVDCAADNVTIVNPLSDSNTTASTSAISGGVDVLSDYMLGDAIRATPGWVVQPYGSLNLGSGFSANAWATVGLETSNGNELDIGLTYERPLGGGVTGRLTAVHYVLFGNVPDMQEFTVGIDKDGFDLSVSYFTWAGGLQDGFRLTGKYNFSLTPKLAASVGAVYETGLEAPDTFVPQAGLTYDLGRGFSAKLNAYFPHKEDGIHERRLVFGLSWSF